MDTHNSNSSSSSLTISTRVAESDSNTDGTSESSGSLLEEHSGKCPENCVDLVTNPCLEPHVEVGGRSKSFCCNSVSQCVWAVILLLVSISGFIFTPQDFMLWEKLNMRPGLPPFEWWVEPPDEVRLRVYVFNVTNHERFLQGFDKKLDVREIGPIVYLEKLLHSNVKFNDNSTMTYTATRFPIYLPEENNIDLNGTLIVPNLAVLGMSSYLHDAPYIVRAGFRLMVSSYGSQFFVKKTIQEYLWDFREPVLETSRSLAPGLIPVNNMGMLARIYADFTDEMTVFIGHRWGEEKFFQIDKFRGQPQLPGFDAHLCPDRLTGSTEGVMYRQRLTKQDVLLYWRKTVCKTMPLYFNNELVIDNVPVYRYNLSESVFERVTNETDCYDSDLPSGIIDASKCYFDFPMVISYPHFYTGQPPPDTYVTGLKPDRFKHNSYIDVEPLTGTPFKSVARMQSNLQIHDLSSFTSDYHRFSNLILPLFWAEYNQEGLPARIGKTIHFMTVILPPLSTIFLSLTLLLSIYLIVKQLYIHKIRDKTSYAALPLKTRDVIEKNKMFFFKKQTYINKPC